MLFYILYRFSFKMIKLDFFATLVTQITIFRERDPNETCDQLLFTSFWTLLFAFPCTFKHLYSMSPFPFVHHLHIFTVFFSVSWGIITAYVTTLIFFVACTDWIYCLEFDFPLHLLQSGHSTGHSWRNFAMTVTRAVASTAADVTCTSSLRPTARSAEVGFSLITKQF